MDSFLVKEQAEGTHTAVMPVDTNLPVEQPNVESQENSGAKMDLLIDISANDTTMSDISTDTIINVSLQTN